MSHITKVAFENTKYNMMLLMCVNLCMIDQSNINNNTEKYWNQINLTGAGARDETQSDACVGRRPKEFSYQPRKIDGKPKN